MTRSPSRFTIVLSPRLPPTPRSVNLADDTQKQIILAITGASGAIYARSLALNLLASNLHLHLIISPAGQRLLHDELALTPNDFQSLLDDQLEQHPTSSLTLHNNKNIGAVVASGSFKHQGMVVAPCTSNSLSAIATASSQHLIHRAAYVTLKERRPLILLHRETPLTLVDIRNMETVTLMGGTIMPANPGFYMLPQSINQLADFMTARILDQLDIPHTINARWADQLNKQQNITI